MTSSLVGSEMCIRDSDKAEHALQAAHEKVVVMQGSLDSMEVGVRYVETVSYTHLTLPTICSV
eukprot:1909499-Prorocentrum_lima.AAC.1